MISPLIPASEPTQRTAVYVDAFNLYYGVLKGNPKLKWLDLNAFFKSLRNDEEIISIKYFTAEIIGKKIGIANPTLDRQRRYISALRTLPNVTIIYGKYQLKWEKCGGYCRREYQKPEEKKTDVGIAVSIISDAVDGLMDRIVLVSGDSDLEPAIIWVRARYPKIKIVVYIPEEENSLSPRRNDSYKNIGVQAQILPARPLVRCQFPDSLGPERGPEIVRPKEWA